MISERILGVLERYALSSATQAPADVSTAFLAALSGLHKASGCKARRKARRRLEPLAKALAGDLLAAGKVTPHGLGLRV